MARPHNGPPPPGNAELTRFLRGMQKQQKENRRNLARLLTESDFDYSNRTVFMQALQAVLACGVTNTEITLKVGGVSLAAVGRWIKGYNSPSAYHRPIIISHCCKLLRAK